MPGIFQPFTAPANFFMEWFSLAEKGGQDEEIEVPPILYCIVLFLWNLFIHTGLVGYGFSLVHLHSLLQLDEAVLESPMY